MNTLSLSIPICKFIVHPTQLSRTPSHTLKCKAHLKRCHHDRFQWFNLPFFEIDLVLVSGHSISTCSVKRSKWMINIGSPASVEVREHQVSLETGLRLMQLILEQPIWKTINFPLGRNHLELSLSAFNLQQERHQIIILFDILIDYWVYRIVLLKDFLEHPGLTNVQRFDFVEASEPTSILQLETSPFTYPLHHCT